MKKLLRAIVAAALAWPLASAAQQSHPGHQHSFAGAEKWAAEFDDPKRDAWQKPHEVIQALALSDGAVVADIGAGTGYFSVRLARMVSASRIYAVDTEPDMVRYLGERAKREGLKNVVAVRAKAGDARLPAKADLALLVDVYHHIDARARYFAALRAHLRPGGRVAIVDPQLHQLSSSMWSKLIDPERYGIILRGAGYELAQRHEFLPYQYFLVFRPAGG